MRRPKLIAGRTISTSGLRERPTTPVPPPGRAEARSLGALGDPGDPAEEVPPQPPAEDPDEQPVDREAAARCVVDAPHASLGRHMGRTVVQGLDANGDRALRPPCAIEGPEGA